MSNKIIKEIDKCILQNKKVLATLDKKSFEYRKVYLSTDYLEMAKAELITKGNGNENI